MNMLHEPEAHLPPQQDNQIIDYLSTISKQIIYRACERLISKNEKKQKIAKCTLKEIGKHSLTVLIVKQNNCVHHFMYHKYK